LIVAAIAMNYGPFTWQYLERDKRLYKVGWEWELFRYRGVGICDIRYTREVDGQRVEVDRQALLGHASQWSMPPRHKRVKRKGLEQHDALICSAAAEAWGDDVEIRRTSRCAIDVGWRATARHKLVCAPGRSGGRGKAKRGRRARKKGGGR